MQLDSNTLRLPQEYRASQAVQRLSYAGLGLLAILTVTACSGAQTFAPTTSNNPVTGAQFVPSSAVILPSTTVASTSCLIPDPTTTPNAPPSGDPSAGTVSPIPLPSNSEDSTTPVLPYLMTTPGLAGSSPVTTVVMAPDEATAAQTIAAIGTLSQVSPGLSAPAPNTALAGTTPTITSVSAFPAITLTGSQCPQTTYAYIINGSGFGQSASA